MARRRIATALTLAAVAAGVFALPGPAAAVQHRPHAHAAIVGGTAAAPGSLPWLAFIAYKVGNGSYEVCTGTVVAPNLVLTAAHCAETLPAGVLDNASGFLVVTGSLDWTDTATRQVSAVKEVVTHAASTYTTTSPSGATGMNVIGDAALLVLATPTTAAPITLATGSNLSFLDAGTAAEIAGWGLTNAADPTSLPPGLQVAQTVVQPTSYCLSDVSSFNAAAQLCATDATHGTATACHGDSGGPLVVQAPDATWIQVGITSSGLNNCDPMLPGYFTRVDYIDSWVQNWIAALPPPAPTSTPAPATPSAPPPPPVGSFTGKSHQHAGHLNLTHTSAGIIRLNVEFNLHCPRGRRGPYVDTATWTRSSPLVLTATGGVWGFATSYAAVDGWRFSIAGSFPALGVAAGTLSVTTRNGKCSSGLVRWTAGNAAA